MKTNCPGCAKDLTTLFLLSRWNPYLFQCPHCHASLAFTAASKWVAVSMTLGLVMGAIGIYLEETNVLPKYGAFGLILSVVPLLLVLVFVQRQGRLHVGLAPDRSERLAGRYDYTLVIVLPAFLLLVIGVSTCAVSNAVSKLIPAMTPERYEKQDMVLEQLKAGTLPPERAARLITSGIKADRAQDEFNQTTKRLLSFVGVLTAALATWLLFAGYMALRRLNKRFQSTPSPSGLWRG